jgi:hypothetical protein
VRLRGLKSQFRKPRPKDHRSAVLRCGLPQERTRASYPSCPGMHVSPAVFLAVESTCWRFDGRAVALEEHSRGNMNRRVRGRSSQSLKRKTRRLAAPRNDVSCLRVLNVDRRPRTRRANAIRRKWFAHRGPGLGASCPSCPGMHVSPAVFLAIESTCWRFDGRAVALEEHSRGNMNRRARERS